MTGPFLRTATRYRRHALVGVLLLTALLCSASGIGSSDKPVPPCCFVNPDFVGVCVVQPKRGENCKSILAYLNNPRSTGKNYCSSTVIRGGWKRVDCATGKEVPPP